MAIQTPQYLQNKGYTASLDRASYQSLILAQEGVADFQTHGLVTASAGLTVSVSATRAFIQGDNSSTQGYYHFVSDSATTVTLTTADPSNPRIDAIVARVYDSADGGAGSDQGTLEVVTGTPNGAAALSNTGAPTGAPTIPGTALVLAYVLVGTGAVSLSAAVIQDARITAGYSRGALSIAAAESRPSAPTVYGLLTTPDQIRNIVLPTNGLIRVLYQATWQESVALAGRAAIFVGANQLKEATPSSPPVQETSIPSGGPGSDAVLSSNLNGISSLQAANYSGDVTTGQLVGASTGVVGTDGGVCYIFAAAGTYTISVQYKSTSGTVTAKNRKLWVSVERY